MGPPGKSGAIHSIALRESKSALTTSDTNGYDLEQAGTAALFFTEQAWVEHCEGSIDEEVRPAAAEGERRSL